MADHPIEIDLDDLPPCLQTLLADPPDSTLDRVTVLRNLNIAFRKLTLPRTTAVATLTNLGWFDEDFIDEVVMHGIRASSNYQCREPILRGVCESRVCMKRRLGVCLGMRGMQPQGWLDAGFAVTDLGKPRHDGSVMLRVDGLPVRASELALRYQQQFIQEVLEQRDLRLPPVPDAEFDAWVDRWTRPRT